MPDGPKQAPPHVPGFVDYWQAETLRMREALSGPLEDAGEVRHARAQGTSHSHKILLRAQLLGRREGIGQLIAKWIQGARLALLGLLMAALLAGAAAASGALGDGSRSVNVLLALAALLGLNLLAFVFWLASFFVQSGTSGSYLGELWLWLTRKLARGPDAALVPRALVELLGRNNALRWLLGGVSHGVWAVALLSTVLTLLAMLSARRYGFNWETTLLSADTFVSLTAALGWLPSFLGFAVPPEAVVRASNGLHALPESARILWSSWLIGCVVTYGLIPRVLALALALFMGRRNVAAIKLDESLPGYAELRDRLSPLSEKMGTDAPGGPEFQSRIHPQHLGRSEPDQLLLAGIELAPDTPWPPAPLPERIIDLGVIDTRSQRSTLLDRLQQHPPLRLLAVCDARQTPDRGTIALLADLAGLAAQTHILLPVSATTGNAVESRTSTWHDRLSAAGFLPEQRHTDHGEALAWLAGPPQAATDAGAPHVRT
ncbi:hypothetical protein CR159_09200 [Pollutimonas subterranea]|uniref:DUF2868 domain-containing protein n=1 Tax=Pollutimonas subterranea TaxID=2045210 RepID=A0A2N4U577_9BURK|nr:DUF2868 domain-containing protein [Pollutimonas subterranea]PLC50171.1 hypothetical protein CR159_09200 [Pollutimonas subterranea]